MFILQKIREEKLVFTEAGVRLIQGVCLTQGVCLIQGVRLIRGPLITGFTVPPSAIRRLQPFSKVLGFCMKALNATTLKRYLQIQTSKKVNSLPYFILFDNLACVAGAWAASKL